MRLLYIYVHERAPYKENSEFNFDSSVRIKFKQDEEGPYFEITNGIVLPKHFFSTRQADNISFSAVIARNGGGKTTTARVLHQILSHDKGLGNYLVALLNDENAIEIYSHLFRKPSSRKEWLEPAELYGEAPSEICNPRIINHTSIILSRTNSMGLEEDVYDKLRSKLTMYYCSPLYSSQHPTFFFEKDYFRDVSTTGLLKRAKRDVTHEKMAMGFDPKVNLDEFEVAETLRAMRIAGLLQKRRKSLKDVDFTLPLGAIVSFNKSVMSEVLDFWKKNADNAELTWRGIRELVIATFSSEQLKVPCFCVKTFLFYVLLYWRDNGFAECSRDAYAKKILSIAINLFRKCQAGEDTLEHQSDLREFIVAELKKANLRVLARIFTEAQNAVGGEKSFEISFIRDGEKGRARLFRLANDHQKVKSQTPFLTFDFYPQISSGEMSFLTLWGRILDDYEQLKAKPKNLLVFMDEAETALHPELQRNLVKLTIWFFETMLPKVKVHIIFASHSPILLSDIPRGNVIFLERKGVMISVADEVEIGNTFGANIFDLYRGPFGVTKGQWGQFAYEKIRQLFDKVNEKRPFDKNDEKLIPLIGDNLVRDFLAKQKRFRADARQCKIMGEDYI